MYEIPCDKEETIGIESWVDEHVFLITSSNPWYGTSIIYLQTQRIDSYIFSIEWCHIQTKHKDTSS